MPNTEKRRIAVDTRTGTIGEVMAEELSRVYLRPLHGGPEWALPASRIRPATPDDVKSAG
jgi:hypothetical protein